MFHRRDFDVQIVAQRSVLRSLPIHRPILPPLSKNLSQLRILLLDIHIRRKIPLHRQIIRHHPTPHEIKQILPLHLLILIILPPRMRQHIPKVQIRTRINGGNPLGELLAGAHPGPTVLGVDGLAKVAVAVGVVGGDGRALGCHAGDAFALHLGDALEDVAGYVLEDGEEGAGGDDAVGAGGDEVVGHFGGVYPGCGWC
jgi:hypothetical protein